MKQLILRVAKYSGLFALSRYLTRGKLRILAYHGVWLGDGHYGNFLYMSAQKFADRMAWLKERKTPVLFLDEALRRQEDGTLPPNATVITIDDGWYSTYSAMWPEIRRHCLPATLYVTSYYMRKEQPVFNVMLSYIVSTTKCATLDISSWRPGETAMSLSNASDIAKALDLLGEIASGLKNEQQRQGMAEQLAQQLGLDWDRMHKERWFHLVNNQQLQEMAREGLDIQLHTHRHRIADDQGYCIIEEIDDNRAELNEFTSDASLTHFCYPSGVYEPEVWPLLEQQGIASATTTDIGLVDRHTHRYALPRILDGEALSLLELEAEMSGFMGLLKKLDFRK